jgi:hypothetical protein
MKRVLQADDFTGGLNLEANVFQLAKNQSSDMLNVDVNSRGGVQRRLGCERRNTSAIGSLSAGNFNAQRLFGWDADQGRKLMLATDTKVFHSTTGNFTDLTVTSDAILGSQFAGWTKDSSSDLYINLGHGYSGVKWDGTTKTTLTTSATGAWQNDLTNPNGTHMPRANHITVHQDRLWVADTYENSVRYPNRVRFSHPLFPESWREDDYIDVVGGGSGITGIVPIGGHLVVFKPQAVYAIHGYSDDTFQLIELTRVVGAVNARAWVATDYGVYFFSYPDGVYFYDGKGIRDVFQNLRPIIYTAEINETALDEMSMGYANKKLFVSLPTGLSNTVNTTYDNAGVTYDQDDRKYSGTSRTARATVSFVFNETVGKAGAWTVYRTHDDYAYLAATTYTDPNGKTHFVAAHPHQPYVFNFDVPDVYTDNITGTATAYDSYYLTPWLDAGNYVTKKFWRRPDFVVRKEKTAVTLGVAVYHDWDSIQTIKSFSLSSPAVDTSTISYEGWNDPELGSSYLKADSLGLARAVQLKISDSSGNPWCVNSVAYKFNPRGVEV